MENSAKFAPDLLEVSQLTLQEFEARQRNANVHGKYDLKNGVKMALPYNGFSVIHNISQPQARDLGIQNVAEKFSSTLSRNAVDGAVATVDLGTVHITTLPLINQPEHAQIVGSENYARVERDVVDAAGDFLEKAKSQTPVPGGTATATGISMFPPFVVTIPLELDDRAATSLAAVRQELHGGITQKVPEFSLVQPALGQLRAHITLAYLPRKLSETEISGVLNALKVTNCEVDFSIIRIPLSIGEVTRFRSMDDYEPVRDHEYTRSTTQFKEEEKIRNWDWSRVPGHLRGKFRDDYLDIDSDMRPEWVDLLPSRPKG